MMVEEMRIFNDVILISVCHCLQAQNDDFSVIFNLEDYKGISCLVVLL